MGKVSIAESLAAKIEAHKNFCESNSTTDFTRTKNDSFLFMNVVLSDLYIERMKTTGLTAKRDQLDLPKHKQEKVLFWHNVLSEMQTVISEPMDDISDFLQLVNDPNGHINDDVYDLASSNPKWKDPAKDLFDLFKTLRKKWTKAHERFTQSGSHDSDFLCFCEGDRQTYYFNLLLKGKGLDILEAVKTSLPDNVKLSSTTPPRDISGQPQSSPGSKRKPDNLIHNICTLLEAKETRDQQKHEIVMRKQTEHQKSPYGLNKIQLMSSIRETTKYAVENEKQMADLEKDLPELIPERENESPSEVTKRRRIERRHKILEKLWETSEVYYQELESMQSLLRLPNKV